MKHSNGNREEPSTKAPDASDTFVWAGKVIHRRAGSSDRPAVKARMLSSAAAGTSKKEQFNPARFTSALEERYHPKGIGVGVELSLEKIELVDWLRKKHPADRTSMALADRLEACKTNKRCLSLACPKCSHAAQAFTTEVVTSFLATHPEREKIVCVSVVPTDGMVPKGKLTTDQHARNIRRWRDTLARVGVTWFLGATDWSFNEHASRRYPPTWQEHFYGFTVTDDPAQLKKGLKKQFPPTDAIPRPVRVEAWDGNKKAVRYMLKPVFWRRIATDEGQRHDKDSAEKRGCRATDKQPLRSAEKHELLMLLAEIGIQGRFLMRWLQFVNLGSSGWSVVDRAPKRRMRGNGQSR
jgi:hypothetical protein